MGERKESRMIPLPLAFSEKIHRVRVSIYPFPTMHN